MFEVFKVERENTAHFYYSEGVEAVSKNCVVKLLDNSEITCEVIPTLYCKNKATWKCIGYLVNDMSNSEGQYDNNAHIHQMRHSANQRLPE